VSASEWRYQLLGRLEAPGALRVYSTEELIALIRDVRPSAALITARAAVEGLVAANALTKVSKGVFLNRRCTPPTELGEVAQVIRKGAFVSLESVLGECGFLNNPPAIVTAVLPLTATHRPNVGEVRTSGGQVFRFHALPARYFPQSREENRQMMQPGRHYQIFRPEAAALHWLHLAKSVRSKKLQPPQDIDFSVLNLDLLKELAWKWELSSSLAAWMDDIEGRGDTSEPAPPEASVRTPEDVLLRREQSSSARARLLARRSN
jgi:hypothetical protein